MKKVGAVFYLSDGSRFVFALPPELEGSQRIEIRVPNPKRQLRDVWIDLGAEVVVFCYLEASEEDWMPVYRERS